MFSNHVDVIAVLANFAGFHTLVYQIEFSLELARSNNSMSVSACAVVNIGDPNFYIHCASLSVTCLPPFWQMLSSSSRIYAKTVAIQAQVIVTDFIKSCCVF